MKQLRSIISFANRISKNAIAQYFIFIGILMITNIALLFTEAMSIPAKFAFILLPLGGQLLLLALIRKPGLTFLLLLPKSILDAFQLVLIQLYGGSFIAVDMFLNVVTTSPSEAGELLANMAPVIVFLLIVYVPAIVLSVRSLKKNIKLENPFRATMIKKSVAILLIGTVFFTVAQYTRTGFRVKYDLYPLNVIYNMDFAIKKWKKINGTKENIKDFTYNASRDISHISEDTTGTNNKREIYVLVIGETARAANWSLYGYDRKTTPNLDTLSNLVVFRDALTQSNTTHKSVPMLLTPSNADNHSLIYKCKSIITLFKEVNFKTVYLTNHNYQQTFMENYFNEADISVSIKDPKKNSYDYELVDTLDSILNKYTADNLFVVVHLYGSHFNYHQRYTGEFAQFKPDKAEAISPEFKSQLINSYDNSILSTDHILNRIITSVNRSNAVSGVLYTSDHGEDLMDDKRKKFLHASPIPTFYQLHVPFVIWFSDEYKVNCARKYDAAVLNAEKPVSTSLSVFHTLGDMASIRSEHVEEVFSVCSSNLQISPRKYLTDHDGSKNIHRLLFSKLDYEQFKKRGIALY